jgi:hypothetical protein
MYGISPVKLFPERSLRPPRPKSSEPKGKTQILPHFIIMNIKKQVS